MSKKAWNNRYENEKNASGAAMPLWQAVQSVGSGIFHTLVQPAVDTVRGLASLPHADQYNSAVNAVKDTTKGITELALEGGAAKLLSDRLRNVQPVREKCLDCQGSGLGVWRNPDTNKEHVMDCSGCDGKGYNVKRRPQPRP